MPVSPNPSTPTIRPDLVAVMEEFDLEANAAGFIGLELFPVTDVGLTTADIGRIKIQSLLVEAKTERAPGAGYNETTYEFEPFSYATKDHGQQIPIDDRLRNAYKESFDAEAVAAKKIRHIVMQSHERRVVALATDTVTFTNVAASALWSNKASADPVADVVAALFRVRNQCGMRPNAVALDFETYTNAIECASVIDRLKSSGYDDPKKVNERALAQLFKVDKIIVSGGLKNIAVPNAANTGISLKPCWPRNVVGVGCVANSPDLQQPCLGRTYHWSADGSAIGGTIETWRNEERRSDMIRARMETDEKVYMKESWTLITGTAAAA